MPARDNIHDRVKQTIIKDGWEITDDPYIISFGERLLFVDLAAQDLRSGNLIGVQKENCYIAIEIKNFSSRSPILDLEQALGQYILYQLLLKQVDPDRQLYLAVTDQTYAEIFSEPIGQLVLREIALKLIVIDINQQEIKQWIPTRPIEKLSSK